MQKNTIEWAFPLGAMVVRVADADQLYPMEIVARVLIESRQGFDKRYRCRSLVKPDDWEPFDFYSHELMMWINKE